MTQEELEAFARSQEGLDSCADKQMPVAEPCLEGRGGYFCTRAKGHEGPHVAHGSIYPVCAVWDDESFWGRGD